MTQPGTIIRMYKGKQQADANAAFAQDAAQLSASNYFPTTQSWAQGQWGCGAWLVALLLCLLLIGILVFVYMLIVKPAGTLTVTYQYREPSFPAQYPASAPVQAPATPAAPESPTFQHYPVAPPPAQPIEPAVPEDAAETEPASGSEPPGA